MDSWIGLVGVVIGGLIGFVTQRLSESAHRTHASRERLEDAVTDVIALAEDYRNRVWEQRHGLSSDSVASWDLQRSRLARARLLLLAKDQQLLAAEGRLQHSGTELGASVRLHPDDAGVQVAWQAHREALDQFVVEGRRVLS